MFGVDAAFAAFTAGIWIVLFAAYRWRVSRYGSFKSDRVRVHFDTGNIMMYQFPEHWIAQLGGRIKNVHLKEFTKKGTDVSLEAFRPLLDGTTNWPAVLEAFDQTGYRGYLTFEYFHPYQHFPEALVFQTADSLDRMLGRKVYPPDGMG